MQSEEAAPQPSRLPGRPRSSAAGGGGWGGGSAAGLRAGRAPWAGVWAPTTTPRAASTRTRTAPEVSAGPRGGRTGGLPPASRGDPWRAGGRCGSGPAAGPGPGGGTALLRSAPAFPHRARPRGCCPGRNFPRAMCGRARSPRLPQVSPLSPGRCRSRGAAGHVWPRACAPRTDPPGWGLCAAPPARSAPAAHGGGAAACPGLRNFVFFGLSSLWCVENNSSDNLGPGTAAGWALFSLFLFFFSSLYSLQERWMLSSSLARPC